MKTKLICTLLVMVLLSQLKLNAQADSNFKYGIYMSSNDYMHNRLSYSFDKTNHNNHLVLYTMFGSPKLQIVNNGEKKVFKKKDIYGYRDNGINYRVFNGDAFVIVDTADFFFYMQTRQVTGMKWHPQKQTYYYFSLTANSNIEALTKTNIENAVAYNNQFDHYLSTTFKSDEELIAYDKRNKKYKLKYLYEEFESGTAK